MALITMKTDNVNFNTLSLYKITKITYDRCTSAYGTVKGEAMKEALITAFRSARQGDK